MLSPNRNRSLLIHQMQAVLCIDTYDSGGNKTGLYRSCNIIEELSEDENLLLPVRKTFLIYFAQQLKATRNHTKFEFGTFALQIVIQRQIVAIMSQYLCDIDDSIYSTVVGFDKDKEFLKS